MTMILLNAKWKSKALIKRALVGKLKPNDNVPELDPTNPLIDLSNPSLFGGGGLGIPEEHRKFGVKKNVLVFTNRKRSFYGQFIYNEKTKKWSVK